MNRLTLAAACAAVFTLAAGSAFADDAVVAKLQQPLAAKTKFIAGGAMFLCEADACVAASPSSQTFSAATCKVVAGKVGPLVSFAAGRPLDDTRLATCNTVAVARLMGPVLARQ